jgi:hypothetical protein
MRGPPGTREVLVRYAVRQAYGAAWRRLLASRRWTGAQKADALFVGAITAVMTLFPLMVVAYGWWLGWGGGPVRWLGLARCVAVDPWRGRRVPPDLQEGFRTFSARWDARVGDYESSVRETS